MDRTSSFGAFGAEEGLLRPVHARLAALLGQAAQEGSLRALVRLRWVALAAMLLTTLLTVLIWLVPLPLLPIAGLFAALALSNLLVERLGSFDRAQLTGAVILFDVGLLTALLSLTGGPANPFTILFVVQVMLTAVMSTQRWTWGIVAASSLGFGLLFWVSAPLPPELGGHPHTSGSYSIHLRGMWVAYVLGASAVALFVSRLSDALRLERERQERASRLLGLAALAAGAAHEIGNPLGTIRLAADDLEEELRDRQDAAGLIKDVQLIGEELGRAKAVLDRMAAAAGELRGEAPQRSSARAVLERAVQLAGDGAPVKLELDEALPQVRWPAQATAQALCQLVRNAILASPQGAQVLLRARPHDFGVELQVIDRGRGIAPELLPRVGEPFFTTRGGQGTGLGVFVARSLIEQLGGELRLDSKIGVGTTATLFLPGSVAPQ